LTQHLLTPDMAFWVFVVGFVVGLGLFLNIVQRHERVALFLSALVLSGLGTYLGTFQTANASMGGILSLFGWIVELLTPSALGAAFGGAVIEIVDIVRHNKK
jgi:hypothetical protein